jgi:hypothetical protein
LGSIDELSVLTASLIGCPRRIVSREPTYSASDFAALTWINPSARMVTASREEVPETRSCGYRWA